MADVDEIIDFIKSIRRGFDKDLFQSKLDELAFAVDSTGLVYDDFHTLFKVWLHLSLPITKWVSLGVCLAPPDLVEERTVQYALKWILSYFRVEAFSPRICFLLDWLTVAMDCDCIDMTALDTGYEVFYSLLALESISVHAVKLVYTLAKPMDVTRQSVLKLLDMAKKRENNKGMLKQLQVLLGLFKSYKPECVPEDIPAFPIYTVFKKLNDKLCYRFRITQQRRNRLNQRPQHLMWTNPINCEKSRSKKAVSLIPNVEFINPGRYGDNDQPLKSYLDFSEPASLVQYNAHHAMSRPAYLRSLLCNPIGQILVAFLSHSEQAFLSHNLHHLLSTCFFEASPYSYVEKQDLLVKLNSFQRLLVQGVPVVTRFLAQYLPFWNEKDYFPEILELAEWVSADCPEHVQQIAERMSEIYLRAQPMEQCAIVRSLTNMYTNLVYASTKSRQHFLCEARPPPASNYLQALPALAAAISTMCHKGLQVDPGDMRVVQMSMWSALRRSRAERAHGASVGAVLSPLALALPLLGVSPLLIENMAELMILYRKIMVMNTGNGEHIEVISKYFQDIMNCLYSEEAFVRRDRGLVFQGMNPLVIDKVGALVPDIDAKFSLRNHVAFAPNTYFESLNVTRKDADNRMLFHMSIEQHYPQLALLMKKTLHELKHY